MASRRSPNDAGFLGHVSTESRKWWFGKKSNSAKPGSPDPGGPIPRPGDNSQPIPKAEPGLENPLSPNR